MVRGLQERAARAQPAEHVEDLDGWRLRYASGSAWWTGTVLPHGDARPGELLRRIGRAEEFYARRGTAARFQICPPACAQGLDDVLAGRGYCRHSPVSLQVARTADVLAAKAPTIDIPTVDLAVAHLSTVDLPIAELAPEGRPDAGEQGVCRVLVDERPAGEWFKVWHAVHGHGGDPRAESGTLGRVALPAAYASVLVGDAVVAVGRAVADTGWAGVFGMATRPEARGTGAGRGVLAALARWAGEHQAERMHLQVEHDNVGPFRLYGRAGFSELCSFHYRAAG